MVITVLCDCENRPTKQKDISRLQSGEIRILREERGVSKLDRRCIQKFPDWPPGARTANGITLCH
jgi:hypothetical protein